MTRRDEHLWEEEVVEIFLDVDRSGHNYYELEISPANVVCDLRMIDASPMEGGPATGTSRASRRACAVRRTRPGTDDRLDRDGVPAVEGPSVLPSAARVTPPPRPGRRWRFNVFRIERPGGKAAPEEGRRGGGVVEAVRRRASTTRRCSATSCSSGALATRDGIGPGLPSAT